MIDNIIGKISLVGFVVAIIAVLILRANADDKDRRACWQVSYRNK